MKSADRGLFNGLLAGEVGIVPPKYSMKPPGDEAYGPQSTSSCGYCWLGLWAVGIRTAVTVGTETGTGCGKTPFDGPDGGPVMLALFVAVTVNVYVVPFVRPVTVAEVALPDAEPVDPPGSAVTVKPATATPPPYVPGDHDTVADASPATADTCCGGPGAMGWLIGCQSGIVQSCCGLTGRSRVPVPSALTSAVP